MDFDEFNSVDQIKSYIRDGLVSKICLSAISGPKVPFIVCPI